MFRPTVDDVVLRLGNLVEKNRFLEEQIHCVKVCATCAVLDRDMALDVLAIDSLFRVLCTRPLAGEAIKSRHCTAAPVMANALTMFVSNYSCLRCRQAFGVLTSQPFSTSEVGAKGQNISSSSCGTCSVVRGANHKKSQ